MKLVIFAFLAVFMAFASPALAQEEDGADTNIDEKLEQELTISHSLDEVQLLVAPLTLKQLTVEAEEWQNHVQRVMTRVASLKVAALGAEGSDIDRIHEKINEITIERAEIIDKYQIIIDSMELKGADPELVTMYRQYISGSFASELQATDAKTIISQVVDWAFSTDGGIGFLISAATIIGSLLLLIIVARFVRSIAAKGIRRISSLSKLLQDFLLMVVFWLTLATGLMIVLSKFGVNITPLFAVLGGASFIIAFAMQETLGNLASGLMIMINKPFDVGDLIDTNGIIGTVETVSIVSTTIRTLDNQVVILPNSQVWGSIITNVTVSPIRRVDMVFGIGYQDDIDAATRVMASLVEQHPLVLDDPEPMIAVHELADSSVNFICRPWVKTHDYWTVYWDLTRQVKDGFDNAGVSIPFPQRDVHIYQES